MKNFYSILSKEEKLHYLNDWMFKMNIALGHFREFQLKKNISSRNHFVKFCKDSIRLLEMMINDMPVSPNPLQQEENSAELNCISLEKVHQP